MKRAKRRFVPFNRIDGVRVNSVLHLSEALRCDRLDISRHAEIHMHGHMVDVRGSMTIGGMMYV